MTMTALVFTSTFSKDPSLYGLPEGVAVESAYNTKLVLADYSKNPPKKWVVKDFVSGLGSSLFGYNPPAQRKHIDQFPFIAPSLPHSLEYSVADKLSNLLGTHVPGWTPDGLGVRWCKTGSEATIMAVRLARAVTGNGWVICFKNHYHGWGDSFIARTEPALGLPHSWDLLERCDWAGVWDADWGDKEFFLRERPKNVDFAAVIFEQPATDPDSSWYPFLRKWCNDNGALLIADETVTGLRYGLGGASERYGIEPDLYCLGKALGNGLPINALVGRREYMEWFAREDPVFCSSTFWGETAGLAAADWVLDNWDETDVAYIWAIGGELMFELQEAGWSVMGHGARSVLQFESDTERAFFIHGMLDRGYLFNRPNFPCMAHKPDDPKAVGQAASEVRWAWNQLGPVNRTKVVEGKIPRVLFKNR